MDEFMEIIKEQEIKVIPLVRAKVLPDDVDDVMEDIRIAFWISLPKHRGESKLSTHAYKIAKNKIADHWRRVYRRRRINQAIIENYQANILPERESVKTNYGSMSPAEKEVFQMLSRGMDNNEISRARFTTRDTTCSHVKSVYKKLGLHNRTKAALFGNKIFTK